MSQVHIVVKMVQPLGPNRPVSGFEIKVYSQLKTHVAATTTLFPGYLGVLRDTDSDRDIQIDHRYIDSPQTLQKAAFITGAAAAEYLCENHGDAMDPETVGKETVELLIDLLGRMADASKAL